MWVESSTKREVFCDGANEMGRGMSETEITIEPLRRLIEAWRLDPNATAEVTGCVIEGHVPAASAVRQLLEQRPIAVGLTVPGMPAGSPGMEGGVPTSTKLSFSERLADSL